MLFAFIPLIRTEVAIWIKVRIRRRIRKDDKRPNHVAGIPDDLWKGIAKDNINTKDYGFKHDPIILEEHLQRLAGYDLDDHLPQITMDWLQQR